MRTVSKRALFCLFIRSTSVYSSCGEPFNDSLVAKPEHLRTELTSDGELLGVAVKPILAYGKHWAGLLSIQHPVSLLLGSRGRSDLVPYEFAELPHRNGNEHRGVRGLGRGWLVHRVNREPYREFLSHKC